MFAAKDGAGRYDPRSATRPTLGRPLLL